MALTLHYLRRGRHRKPPLVQVASRCFTIGYSAQDSFFDLDPVFDGVRQLVEGGINAMISWKAALP
jgi:hypothetical protein